MSRYYGSSYGGGSGSNMPGNGSTTPPREYGARRKRLAAIAGSVYRAGAAAATEIKSQYDNTRIRNVEAADHLSIPGAFPDVKIIHNGEEQMVLFPSYAMRHVGQSGKPGPAREAEQMGAAQHSMDDEEYWRHEWARLEDQKAIVDVDVRGWIYMPSKGPMTRRNRMLIGLARRLSGIPAPTTTQAGQGGQSQESMHEEHERLREERRIAKEAREIERRGQGEKEVASKGCYSETPREDDDEFGSNEDVGRGGRSGTHTPISPPGSPTLPARTNTFSTPASGMSEAELAVANANLMARLGPFMTTPLVQAPVTLFFYNEKQSQSRTIMTNDSGHFFVRAALDFVPTHVRVLANEGVSCVQPIQIIESRGVSLISDIDDTIKRSNIALGAREIFRNTFIRELADLTVEGVREWYHAMANMGVQIHYCSNSPWQLFPVLATYFLAAGLPQGSIHLKHYSGMLQGIFEPVAERKKGTLEKILRDFPERKFLLVGDSGEADLEVYTELAFANPGRILAIFIRDVTTPEQLGYFDTSFGGNMAQRERRDTRSSIRNKAIDEGRPKLPPRVQTEPSSAASRPTMGTLIDFSDEPEPAKSSEDLTKTDSQSGKQRSASNVDLLSRKPRPPPRPAKPAALRSTPSDLGRTSRSQSGSGASSPHPLTKVQTASAKSLDGPSSPQEPPSSASNGSKPTPPPPPPPRRRGTPVQLSNIDSEVDELEPLAAATYPVPGVTNASNEPVNKRVDLWRQRLARAHEILDQQGVQLYTWRRGEDVIREAEGIVKEALRGGQR